VEVTLEDIATANRLAGEVLGRSLDEMPPQTRRFLELLWSMVQAACTAADIEPKTHRFTQRDARAYTNWSSMQVKRHLGKLAELEYLLTHRGGRGQSFVYELLYAGEGTESSKFLLGLFDPAKLAESTENARPASDYDDNRGGQNDDRGTQKAEWGTSGAPQGHTRGTRGAEDQNGSQPSKINGSSATPAEKPQNAQPGKRKNFDEIKVVTPAQGAAVATTNHELPTTN
jgi:hypothetical protein